MPVAESVVWPGPVRKKLLPCLMRPSSLPQASTVTGKKLCVLGPLLTGLLCSASVRCWQGGRIVKPFSAFHSLVLIVVAGRMHRLQHEMLACLHPVAQRHP